jgi:hypothetical protein
MEGEGDAEQDDYKIQREVEEFTDENNRLLAITDCFLRSPSNNNVETSSSVAGSQNFPL